MWIVKQGVYKEVDSSEYGYWFKQGYRKSGGNPEPQAPQENIKVVDELTVTKEEEPVVDELEQPKLIAKPKKPKNK